MAIGGSVYRQKQDLLDYERDSKGGSVFWGMGARDFGQLTLVYSLEDVFARYSVVRTIPAGSDPRTPHGRPLPPPYDGMPRPDLFFEIYNGITSSFTPSYGFDSRDDPFDPNQGKSYFGRLRYAGGVLGGDFNYLRPEAGFTWFRPLTRRYILAVNLEGGLIWSFSSSLIPTYDRYRLGGERSLRGLPYYGVLPRKANGDYFLTAGGAREGGDRYLQINLEYQIKVGGPIKFILFSDIGNTWHEEQGWEFNLLRYTAGGEFRIFLPIFQAPLRFIYGVNLKPFDDEKKSDFQFSIGTTF
jgi:outer membrane protein insertion porin family